MVQPGDILWWPSPGEFDRSSMERFRQFAEARSGVALPTYQDLYSWSVTEVDAFWMAVAEFTNTIFHDPVTEVRTSTTTVEGCRWFAGSSLNYAEHCLRGALDDDVLVAYSEARPRAKMTRGELRSSVGAIRAGLLRLGVSKGDRVAAYMPNCPESIAAMLATASIGAVWTSCAPDFGAGAVIDRLEQIEPVVLLAVNGYVHRGRHFERVDEVDAIVESLPGLRHIVVLDFIECPRPTTSIGWETAFGEPGDLSYEPVEFSHPLVVLFSSGTTGKPKPIVHGHGAMVLENAKWLKIHEDITQDDVVFWFSSTTWMAWNLSISSLMCGARLVIFDGDPQYPDIESFWRRIGEEHVTYLGISPAFIAACKRLGIVPKEIADLSRIRTVTAGGAPLPASSFAWVYENVNADLYLASSSGGTDVASSIVGGCRILPVRAGFIACRLLGIDSVALSADGSVLPEGAEGELVLRQPIPSMPVGFWGDDGSRMHESYFERFPGMWAHGDWITFFEDGTSIISGRSDATLNRGGVRLGTSEIYSVIDDVPEVADCLAVHLEDQSEGGFGELILFVEVGEDVDSLDQLALELKSRIRQAASPRHVPDLIVWVPGVPRTVTGKRMEVPVKRLLLGYRPDMVANLATVANPSIFEWYSDFAKSRSIEEPTHA